MAPPVANPASEPPAETMARYGIECVPVDVFHWNGFRYSSLKDAVNAAKRVAHV